MGPLQLALALTLAAAEPAGEALFARSVRPLLKAKCLACHGDKPADLKGGLDLRSAPTARAGGDSGKPAVVPGKPDDSPLYLSATRTHDDWSAMPPKQNDQLTEAELKSLRDWVAAGADWPDEKRVAELTAARKNEWDADSGVTVATSGGLSPDWTNRRYKPADLWAYQPVRRPAVPAGPNHPIDAFLRAKTPAGLTAAPPADRVTLVRRLTFDLLGLPPTPEETDAFVNDPAPDAYEKLVDRLLASPHYGERMARHWLDVVRYADSAGFANDYERGPAWRYRDYVVRALNADKPYDRFVKEQLAGDEIDPADPEMLVAVGFLRMGPWELTGMEVAKVARQRFLDDVTDGVGQTFLGHMLQCARCHDHKFDPVPTRDYYRVQAAFATTQLADRPAPFLPSENTAGFDERKYIALKRAEYEATLARLDAKSLAAAEAWFAERKLDPAPFRAAAQPGKGPKARGGFEAARAALMKRGVPEDKVPPKALGFTTEDFGLERIARKGLERLAWEADRYEPVALSVYSGKTPDVKAVYAPPRVPANRDAGELEATAILAGGDPFGPAEPVTPGVLSAVPVKAEPLPTGVDGRRKALADWVASPANPLTARVLVNRVWLWHLGRPLAGNPNNFGATGKKPTHPELLDWLTAEFVRDGWSVKKLHRLILTSEVYRRSCDHPDRAALAKLDPNGTSYATFTPRRLSAEEIRDAMLRVSGELTPALGGIPVRPEINPEAAMQPRQVMGTFAAAWEPSPRPDQRNRRSLYALKLRGLRDPFAEVFNEPTPDLSCECRESSLVTPQVFALFNGKPSADRALAFADRLRKEAGTREAAIGRAFRLAFGRAASDRERAACLAHWSAAAERQRAITPPKPERPAEVVREAVEENTGEKFTFREPLYAAADFVPGLQACDADAETRALADVCLVLFNANEFAFVY